MVEFQSVDQQVISRGSETPPTSGPRIGNFRLMLQVRYCGAALIIDERMQI